MKKILYIVVFNVCLGFFFTGCANDDLTPFYEQQVEGKVVIRGYSALPDSLQLIANGTVLDNFTGEVSRDYEFVYYGETTENIDLVNKATGSVVHSYAFTKENTVDTLSFYIKDGIWLDNVLAFEPGVLSTSGRTGYRFIFPTLNRYSNSGYEGPLDAIIRKTNGDVLGVAENITKDTFSTFVEFGYAPPPILNVEIVKHGTTESYITGQQVITQMVMQNNKSRLIVLDEKADANGSFTGVDGTINLVDYFDF